VPDAVRGRVFTLLDVTWSAMRLLGGLLVDAVGIESLFWMGGAVLATARVLGLVLLGGYNVRVSTLAKAA
jgi:hypothetical protein